MRPPSGGSTGRGRIWRFDGVGVGVFAVTLILYWLFPNRHYLGDGLLYAMDVEQGQALFHPHHLFYSATGYGVWSLLKPWGMVRALEPMTYLNIVAGALTIGLFYLTLRSLTDDRRIAAVGTLLLAFSFGWWLYAISVETYTIPLLFLVFALYLVARQPRGSPPATGTVWGLALLSGLACLYHQSHIFFVPGMMLLLRWRQRVGWRFLGYYGLLTGIVIAVPYLIMGVAQGARTPDDFTYWLTSYAHRGLWGHGLTLRSFPVFFSTAARAVWALPKTLWWSSGTVGRVAALLLGMTFTGSLALLLWWGRREWKTVLRRERGFVGAAAIWAVLYGGFTFWWQPGNVEFMLPLLVPIWLLAVLFLQRGGKRRLWGPSLLVVAVSALFLSNFVGRVLPGSQLAGNQGYWAAERLHEYVTAEDLLIVDDYDWQLHLRYFYGGELQALDGLKRRRSRAPDVKAAAEDRLQDAVDDALRAGRRVVTMEYDEHEPLLLREARGLAFSQSEIEAFYSSRYRLEPLFQVKGEIGPYWAYQISAK